MPDLPRLHHRFAFIVQTLLIVVIMVAFLALLGMVIAGVDGALVSLGAGVVLMLFYPSLDPSLIARLFGARPLTKEQAGTLYAYLDELTKRAELPATPKLYYLSGGVMSAFTVGKPKNSAIVLTTAMLRHLSLPEQVAVLAHETAHIANHDLWLMSLTDIISRMTAMLSVIGQAMLFILLPLYLLSGSPVPWGGVLILVFAPLLSSLLQLSLSRIREYDADMTAVYLTGETRHLASALAKIDREEQGLFGRLFFPERREKVPSLFRTHPSTNERIKRLSSLSLPDKLSPLYYEKEHFPRIDRQHTTALRELANYLLGQWH